MQILIIFLILLSLFVFTLGVILIAGNRAKTDLKRRNPPPGKLVDAGGFRLHYICEGKGQPVVVIDSGQGDFSLSWHGLLPEIAKFSTVLAYDRAGLGWSDQSPAPRTAENMVDELRSLLDKSGVTGPYVLVGASLGGVNCRLFAHKYPQDVAGLVLVDSSHEDQFSPKPIQDTLKRMQGMVPVMYGLFKLLVRSGVMALNPNLIPDSTGTIAKMAPENQKTYRAVIASDARNISTQAAEIRDLSLSYDQVRAVRIINLGDLPLVVLQHGKPTPMMASDEVSSMLEDTFSELQKQMAASSTRGRLVIAEESTHTIQLDQPKLVIGAIREVVEAWQENPQNRGSRAPTW
jgi:pimeloyl-ACP methyl ester carboxylesterase